LNVFPSRRALEHNGFAIEHKYGDYDETPFGVRLAKAVTHLPLIRPHRKIFKQAPHGLRSGPAESSPRTLTILLDFCCSVVVDYNSSNLLLVGGRGHEHRVTTTRAAGTREAKFKEKRHEARLLCFVIRSDGIPCDDFRAV
jgi:hypothetical protein